MLMYLAAGVRASQHAERRHIPCLRSIGVAHADEIHGLGKGIESLYPAVSVCL